MRSSTRPKKAPDRAVQIRRISLVLVFVLLFSACASVPDVSEDVTPADSCDPVASDSGPARKLVVSDLGIVGDAPTYIALDHGYFAEQGLDVELQPFRSAVDMIPLLGQGLLDAGTGTLSAGFFNGLSQGIDITVVADSASVAPGSDSHLSLVVHPELAGGVTDYEDLAGLRLAINAQAGGLEVELSKALALGGLALSDVELVYLAFPDMIGAFAAGLIDGAILPEPFLSMGLAAGSFVELAPVGEFYPGHQISVLIFSEALASDRVTATRYLCAYLKGVADFRDALIERTTPPDEVVATIMAHTPIENADMFEVMRYHVVARNGIPSIEAITEDLTYYSEAGYLESTVDIGDFVDLSMVTDAAAALGTD